MAVTSRPAKRAWSSSASLKPLAFRTTSAVVSRSCNSRAPTSARARPSSCSINASRCAGTAARISSRA
eukprot:scaffold164271_cov20-Tisochrysis_lutea.AAC.4